MRFHVYMVCYGDGYREVQFFPADEVQEGGGVEALELALTNDVAWFFPLGDVDARPKGQGYVTIEFATVNRLRRAWLKNGSPKKIGKARGASPFS
jgi:hypothetical protein